MAKGKSLEDLEAQMAKLKEKESALHEQRRALAAERRKLIFAQQPKAGGVVLTPEPAILEAKTEQ